MIGFVKTAAIASCLISAASAALVPTGPSPGDSFNEGSTCKIQYDIDTTGVWTNTTIQLMSGPNLAMVPLMTIISGLDGTTGDGVITFTCPEVTPNSEIYFLQFQNDGDDSTDTWTGRFTIAAADGTSTSPTNKTTTDGTTVYWGNGKLVNKSAKASSVVVSGVTSATGAASAASSAVVSTSTSSATTSASSATTSSVTSTSTTASSTSSVSSSVTTATAAAVAATSSTTASGAGSVKACGALAGALAIAAFALA